MVIDNTNCHIGNKAMASVLLLYYHLLDEGGITHDQTVYIDPEDFNGFDFLSVRLKENTNESLNISESLLREGAVIYLLCELNDIIGEYDKDFNSQPYTKKITNALLGLSVSPISEIKLLLDSISVPETKFNYYEYNEILKVIYKKYVYNVFKSKLA